MSHQKDRTFDDTDPFNSNIINSLDIRDKAKVIIGDPVILPNLWFYARSAMVILGRFCH